MTQTRTSARRWTACLLLIAPLLALPAQAREYGFNVPVHAQMYYGLGLVSIAYETEEALETGPRLSLDEPLEFAGAFPYFRLGTSYDQRGIFRGELRVGAGFGDDQDDARFQSQAAGLPSSGTLSVQAEPNSLLGAYVLLGTPTDRALRAYALLGVSRVEMDLEATLSVAGEDMTLSERVSDGDVSYGVGIDWKPAERMAFHLEYVQYYDEDDTSIGGLSVGFTMEFD